MSAPTFYKVLHEDGRCFHGGRDRWPLPTDDGPGEWLEVKGDLRFCQRGLHGCRLADLLEWFGPAIFVMEFDGEVTVGDDKVLGRKARLVRRTPWNDSTSGLFAADCAERALRRERRAGREPDPRAWEAVRVARAFARGEATGEWPLAGDAGCRAGRRSGRRSVAARDDAGTPLDDAWDDARAAAGTPSDDARRRSGAARAATWAAVGPPLGPPLGPPPDDLGPTLADARTAERRWQVKRLQI